jgi:surface antigen
VRVAFVAANVAIIAIILAFVLQNPRSMSTTKPLAADSSAIAGTVANPLDQLSSADIAQTVAQVNNLPETTAVTNQAQSQAADLAIASTDNQVISKPQVVATALKSKADIQTYVTKPGDTLSSLAAKFGVTSDSIRWSNNLSAADALTPGTSLVIPPVSGIVYTVKPGDTAASLATQFKTNADQIIAYNDAEISGFTPGEKIIIPNASQNNGATAASIAAAAGIGGGGAFPWGTSPIYGYNGYDYGYCTWYVATQIPVPANWGNASTWAYYAALSGWHVSTTPTVGAIAQKGGGEGHVAIVTAVHSDGSIEIRDMNGIAGWGRVGYGPKSAGVFQHYITR